MAADFSGPGWLALHGAAFLGGGPSAPFDGLELGRAMSSAARQAQPPAEMIKNTVALTLVTCYAGAGAGQETPLISFNPQFLKTLIPYQPGR